MEYIIEIHLFSPSCILKCSMAMYSPMLNKKNKTDAITKAGGVLKIS